MNREIKFRAWDGERLRYVNWLSWIDGELDVVSTSKSSGDSEDYVLMQYTGLKDKNGVQIYEGDILKLNKHGDRVWVQYWKGKFITMVVFKGKYTSRSDYDSNDLSSVNGFGEIIGNLYENPNLLEGESK